MKKLSQLQVYEKQGFTLVELLVVISIIAILSVIGITIFSSVQKNGRDAQRISNVHNLMNALEQYNTVNGRYPSTCANESVGTAGVCCSSWNPDYIKALVPAYIASLPHDPNEPSSPGGPDICYVVNANHDAYGIQYRLEISKEGAGTLIPPGGQQPRQQNGVWAYVYEKNYNCRAPQCQ